MTASNLPAQNDSAAAEQLFQLVMGFIPAISLNVLAKLSIADELANGPKTAEELARKCNVNTDALYRVMRAATAVGVFRELDGRRFEQTPMSDLLRTDNPQTLRPFVEFFPDPLHFRCYSNLMHSVKTGETTVKPTLGMDLFEYLSEHPKDAEVFNAAMANITHMFIPSILEAYDFSGTKVLADVGGGLGSVIAAILQRYPQMKGILFDLEQGVRGAGAYLQAQGVADRCQIVPGDFFKSVTPGADTYIMKNIIHDWDDERSIAILRNVRQALGNQTGGKVLLLEFVLAAPNEPHLSKLADIEMLVLPGGRERSEPEYAALLAKSGFKLTRVVPTKAPSCVIEAAAV